MVLSIKSSKNNKLNFKIMKTIFIATGNTSKLQDFKLYLGDNFNIESPKSLNIKIDVPEGVNSIEDNAIAKARAYAYKTGLVSIGDDTGFFIEELNGEPGVALRRWGGELSEKPLGLNFGNIFKRKPRISKITNAILSNALLLFHHREKWNWYTISTTESLTKKN